MKTIYGEVCGYCGARRGEVGDHTWDSEPWKTEAICERKHREAIRDGYDVLEDARNYLHLKSYNGDQGGDCMNYWEWNVAMCTAIGIVDDRISAVRISAVRLGNPTCEAIVVRHVEDTGYRCGKKCTPGSFFCAEHQEKQN